MFSLDGKTALVTGATGGIGESIARALHVQGCVVGISGRNKEKLDALATSLGARVHVLPADLSDAAATDKLVEDAITAMGKIDILINNAGLTRDNLALRLKDEDWQAVLDVNLTAPFRLARACLKGMMKNRWGRIVNITSIVGVTGNPGQTNYAASKAGMIGWSKSMAAEIASRNVTVNCIAPGFIATAMTHVLNDEQKEKLNGTIPMGRMGTADEIAAAAVYLASNEAAYVTGQTLHVNGGMAMI
ncbi:MAG: 3-oxoacyl-[acyl-carrier-protein] reductase [Proteobacteria bacterium]|nr:3-oxoacyl-[acyl-carrier-protein] reductase [Pseudomonadota bacterium]